MKNIFTFMFAVIIIITALSGCKSSTESEESYKDPSQMTWTIDTLYYPGSMQTALDKFLAFSNKDIFAYGHCDDSKGALYRYDGSQWNLQTGATRFEKMIARSNTNIWGFGGYPGVNILYYNNGSYWTRDYSLDSEDPFYNATDDRAGYIYACGGQGLLAVYDYIWKTETIKVKVSMASSLYFSSVGYFDDKLMLNGKTYDGLGGEWNYFIVKEGNLYVIKDSCTVWPNKFTWGETGFYKSPWGKYYSYGYGGIWEYANGTWTPYYEPTYAYEHIGAMYGLNENYYYIIKHPYTVTLCRGNEQTAINKYFGFELSDLLLTDVWTDGNEVFIIGSTNSLFNKTIIIHGK